MTETAKRAAPAQMRLAPAVSRRRRRRRRQTPLIFWLPFLYVLTIPIPNSLFVPDGIRLAVSNWRPFAIPLIGAVLALHALTKRSAVREWRRSPTHHRALFLALSLPAFFALGAVIKPNFRVTVFALYLVWALFAFLVFPLTIRTHTRLRQWVRLLLLANLAAWIIPAIYTTIRGGAPRVFAKLTSYGYANPDYFSQSPQVVFACLLFFEPRTKRNRWLRLAGLAACVLTIAAAEARNVLLFCAVLAVMIKVIKRTQLAGLVILALATVAVVGSAIGYKYTERSDVDKWSSGRITIWDNQIKTVFDRPDDLKGTLIGPDEIPQQRGFDGGYDRLKKQKSFHKFHIDNSFLELIIEAGVIGLVLFLLPYLFIVRATLQRRGSDYSHADTWAISVLIAVAAQSTLISGVPSFANPISFMFITAVVVLLGFPRQQTAAGPRD